MSTDPSSSNFDPLLALYSDSERLPSNDVKAYDNIATFEGSLRKQELNKGAENASGISKRSEKSFSQRKRREEEAKSRDVGKLKELMEMRKRLDRGEDISAPSSKVEEDPVPVRKKRETKNLLSSMQKLSRGPHSVLHKIVKKHLRCNVYMRDFCGLRGLCCGYIVAFDRYTNLVMVDVDETFRKPPTGKVMAHQKPLTVSMLTDAVNQIALGGLGSSETRKGVGSASRPKHMSVAGGSEKADSSVVVVKPVGMEHFCHQTFHGGMPQLYRRHLPHLLVRGDSIVLVSLKK